MKSQITNQGNNEKLIEVDLTEKELAPYFDTSYRKYQKNIRLQGFRQGKVPLSLIKKLYGEEIKKEALDEVVKNVFSEVSSKEKLRPVAPAKLEDVNYEPGKGLHIKAVVEVVPEIEIKHYKDISVEREIYQVDEEDVAEALENVREQMAVMQPVENEAVENNYILADLQQVDVTGVPIIGKKFEDRFFQLSVEGNNKEFTEQLLGIKAGEIRRIKIAAIKNGNPKEKKDEIFEVTVKEIKSKQLPELDDDLAKDDGNFETLEELKSDIKEQLLQQSQNNSRKKLRDRIIDEILKQNSFDLPESMITNYLDAIVNSARKENNGNFDEEVIRKEYRPGALWNLKWELVKDKIVDIENIISTDEDKQQYISRMVKERGIDEKQLRKSFKNKKTQDRFEDDVLESKVLDFLENNARIKDKKITRKDIEKSRQLAMSA